VLSIGRDLRVDAAALAGLRHLARGPGAAQERNAGQGGGGEAKPDELPPSAERQVTEIIEAFLRFHIAGYRGLRSLKSLAAWEALQPAGPPGDR